MSSLKNISQELIDTKQKLEAFKSIESELKTTRVELQERDVELNNLVNMLKQERYANEELKNLKQQEIESYEKKYEQLEREKEALMKDMETVKESVSENKVNVEGEYFIEAIVCRIPFVIQVYACHS